MLLDIVVAGYHRRENFRRYPATELRGNSSYWKPSPKNQLALIFGNPINKLVFGLSAHLKDACRAHASAYAHGDYSVFLSAALKL